jgi:hypothetical protein
MIIPVTMSNNHIPAGAVLVRLMSENGRAAVTGAALLNLHRNSNDLM